MKLWKPVSSIPNQFFLSRYNDLVSRYNDLVSSTSCNEGGCTVALMLDPPIEMKLDETLGTVLKADNGCI